jgi:transcriptional regulator with XRE-family HTH domain
MATFAERLKEIRNKRGLHQKDIADELGAAENTVSRWERGENRPDDQVIMYLAKYLGVTYAYLIGATDDPAEHILTDEEIAAARKQEEQVDEEQMLTQYRLLSPEMKKMIRDMTTRAYLIDKTRGLLDY